MSNKEQYTELSSVKIDDKVTVVISEYEKGGFTIAQKMTVNNNGRNINVFLKNSIQFENVNGLCDLRDALNLAIQKIKNKKV